MKSDDPLERLAAEEDWQARAKAVEAEVARARRKEQIRIPRPSGRRRARGQGISKLFLAIVALFILSGVTLWTGVIPAQASMFVFVLSGWVITLCFHEFAHALTAHRGGDDTVAGKGYLRLDPRTYGHPVLTLILPLIFLMLGGLPLPGGAVMIESHRLRNRFRDALVSAAGPAVNVAAAAILLFVVSVFGPEWIISADFPEHAPFWAGLTFLAFLQVAGALLNLLPMPGLDGYGIIEPYLPSRIRHPLSKVKPFGILIIFVLLYLPPVRAAFMWPIDLVMDGSGSPVNGAYFGSSLFMFWRDWI